MMDIYVISIELLRVRRVNQSDDAVKLKPSIGKNVSICSTERKSDRRTHRIIRT
jgi:hypothetical protein